MTASGFTKYVKYLRAYESIGAHYQYYSSTTLNTVVVTAPSKEPNVCGGPVAESREQNKRQLEGHDVIDMLTFINVTGASSSASTSTISHDVPRMPIASVTSVSPLNSTNTPSPSPTIDRTCGETTTPFSVQVAQPGGMFDGWYLKLSGDAIIFTQSQDLSTPFSVEGSGHLCAVGHVGTQGNALIAVAENATEVTGGAVYFIDPEVLEDIDELGYAALTCEPPSETLACAQGEMRFWSACGLVLDITSDSEGDTEIGGQNCTGVDLSPVYL